MIEERKRRTDGLPEFHDYKDAGCYLHKSCLTCPRATCIMETPEFTATHRMRDEEIARRHDAGETIAQLATSYSVSRRTIFRILAGMK